jgi:hypothetical protein
MSDGMMAKPGLANPNISTGMNPVQMRTIHASELNFDGAISVISNAQKFIIPIPDLGVTGEELVHPAGSPEAGQPILDYKGNPVGESGVVFFNHKDKAWQAVPGDGNGVIIINEVTRDQAQALLDKIHNLSPDVFKLTAGQIKVVLEYAHTELELGDMYNSTTNFIDSKMTPVESALSPAPSYGFMKRDDRDICKAVYVSGSFTFDGPAITAQVFDNGGVIIKQGDSIRGVQPEIFQRTYRHASGEQIASLSELKAV